MKNFISFILMALLPVVISADVRGFDQNINGILYKFSGEEAIVSFFLNDTERGFTPFYKGDVVIPASVTFEGKTYNVTGIGSYAFTESKDLTSVTIPESVTSIGEGAFSECTSLTSVTIPGSVKSIGNVAFYGCSDLTSLTLCDGVTSIGTRAFGDCTSLTSVSIPNSVTSIGDIAFDECKGLTAVTIPGSMKTISKQAFNGCTSLTSLIIGEGVTSIGNAAFGGCSSLPSVTIPNSVTTIDVGAFSGCSSLASVTVPESVTRIGRLAFNKTAWYDKQPDGLIYLGKVAYKYKGEMPEKTQVEIKEGTTQIAGEAFYECLGLTSIKLPNSLASIGGYAFQGCTGLTAVTLPDGLTSIGEYSFCGCRSLVSINIPDGVTVIHDYTFHNCTRLASAVIPDGVKSLGSHAFSKCSSMASVTIPESVTSIADFAFFRCSSLTSMSLPEGLASIGYCSFNGCSGVKSFIIPSSLKTIERYAFSDCYGLTDMFCYAKNVPQTYNYVFDETPISLATLHVPAGSVEQYQKTSPWSGFGTITALPTEVVTFIKNQMATIILPTEPDASKGHYYRLDRCEDGQIVFEQELQPHARTPYIIVPSEDFSINPSTLDLEGLTQDEVSIEGISFIGSYIGKVLPSLGGDGGGSYYDIIDKTPDCGLSSLGETGKGAFVGALRAYLQVSWDDPYNHPGSKTPGEKMEIVLKDNPNGIETTRNPETKVQSDRSVFDLQGRKVTTDDSSLKKGIYIKGGKKLLKR